MQYQEFVDISVRRRCRNSMQLMYHCVRSSNLPFSLDDVKKITMNCMICAEIKPRFYRKSSGQLIKATKPFERLNVDFKGPIPSSSRNIYLLTIIDEYSRFPFAVPCSDTSSSTVIKAFSQIFSVFGRPSYIHSDRGTSFLSRELTSYLHERGIATSLTTPYNPQGNGQTERYNGIIWKTIQLALRSRNLKTNQWEMVLNEALDSIRTLLCTATNCTPHERMFIHPRNARSGTTLPSWLTQRGPVLVKQHVRHSKFDPTVQRAELIEANPEYALVKFQDGRESTISVKHLAPPGRNEEEESPDLENSETPVINDGEEIQNSPLKTIPPDEGTSESRIVEEHIEEQPLRRSQRSRRPPAYLRNYQL